MDLVWAAEGAVSGLPVAAALRCAVFRFSVAAGEPEATHCPRCAAPLPDGPAVRCDWCGSSLGGAPGLELATAAVLALLLGRFGGQPDAVAFCFLGALGVALAAIDIAVHRLPDRLVLPAYPVLAGVLAAAALTGHDIAALARALMAGLALAAAYLVLALLRPGELGGGDVKLAGLAGMALGWLGWATLLAGALLGFVLSGVASLGLLAARRVTLRSHVAFGPFLIGGVLLAILVSRP